MYHIIYSHKKSDLHTQYLNIISTVTTKDPVITKIGIKIVSKKHYVSSKHRRKNVIN